MMDGSSHYWPHPSQQSESPAKLIMYIHEAQRKIGPVRDSYQSTVALCRSMFPALLNAKVGVYTKDLEICRGQLAEIYAESWEDVVGHIEEIVIVDQSPNTVAQDGAARNRGSKVYVKDLMGNCFPFEVDLNSIVHDLKARIQQIQGTPLDQQRLIFASKQLEDGRTLNYYDIRDGATLHLVLKLRGGKPVIYLLAPVSVEASVELSLVPQWSLSAIYPVTPIKSGPAGMGESVSWKVCVHPEGHLTELSTGLDTAYLYWEALTNPSPPSLPASPHLGHATFGLGDNVQAFDPTNAILDNDNAVLIPVTEVTPYLDAALKALGLHIEARTSFITYWLPSLLKHKYVAFRFLPQASYKQAAPLRVSPTPDIVTRVFMVFEGIEESELEAWPAAQKRGKGCVSSWINIVGVDVGRTVDKGLFRVIEWGGMDISHTKISRTTSI